MLAFALSALWPQPREAAPAPATTLVLPVRVEAPRELAAPAALLQRELAAAFGTPAATPSRGSVIRLSLAPAELKRPEEYAVEPGREGVSLRAHDVQGAFWAVHTLAALLSRAQRTANGYEVPIPRLRDWPDTSFRAFMIQGAWTPDGAEFKRNLGLLARQHVTYFALEFGPQVVLDFDPSIAKGGKFTKLQAKEIIDYGRSLGLKPIGYLNLLGHLDRGYQKEPYTQHGGIDIRSDETYERFVYPVLREMLEVYGPIEYFHCGMDEAWELFTWLSKDGADVTALLTRHIQRVNDFLKARDVKLVIWHDMLIAPDLKNQLGAPVDPANGGPPQNTVAALASIPRDVILDYWFYDPLPAYPALDCLRAQGFEVWASPWQTPFSFVRYAQQRQAPTMGTLWSGPPGCFGSSTYSPVTALYAQAAWNATVAPDAVSPEPAVREAAQRATSANLWRRRSLEFPGKTAYSLWPAGPQRLSLTGEQYYGVPLDTTKPVTLEPLPKLSKPLGDGTTAAAVLLPGAVRVALDGVNEPRGEDQLVLYGAPRVKTGTNLYGVEVMIGADGMVQEISDYGAGDHAIPAGGFVLSAHLGPNSGKARKLQGLRPGDPVAVVDAAGEWLGGWAPSRLQVRLPGDKILNVDGEDTGRGEDQLILYGSGMERGRTGTNANGVEVAVAENKVAQVYDGAGDSPVPSGGYVLSAHTGATGAAAAALRSLKPGDSVRLVIQHGTGLQDLDDALATRSLTYPVGKRCSTLHLAMSAGGSSSPGTRLGQWVIRYADGAEERVPVRYGREILSADTASLPRRTDDPVWLIEQPPLRCLVREWVNPRPEQPVQELVFEPARALLETGAQAVGVTAAEAE